jgi:predicted RNA-binding Zn-ribbon protein involved in translation (DUF1610 family)
MNIVVQDIRGNYPGRISSANRYSKHLEKLLVDSISRNKEQKNEIAELQLEINNLKAGYPREVPVKFPICPNCGIIMKEYHYEHTTVYSCPDCPTISFEYVDIRSMNDLLRHLEYPIIP